MRPALVETTAVEMAPAGFDIRVHGTVVPKREIVVSAEVAGKVVRAAEECRAGTYVKQNDFLLQIERTTFELEIKRLISQMKQVDVDRLQLDIEAANNEELIVIAKTDLAITERELQRLETLATRKAVSASERDQAESAMMKAQNTLQTLLNTQRLIKARRERLDAEHDLTQAKLDLARHDLERTTITAPIDGVVAEQVVEENAFVQPGSPLLKITDTAAIEVKCCLRDEDLYWLWRSGESLPAEGQTVRQQYHAPRVAATVTFTLAGRSYDWRGFLSRFEGVGIDEDTRTIPCRIEVPDPVRDAAEDGPPALMRGMFVSVALHAAPRTPFLQIPYQALRPGNLVWTVADGKLQQCTVSVAKTLADTVLVHAHATRLSEGDKIVVSPLPLASEGMSVREKGQPRP